MVIPTIAPTPTEARPVQVIDPKLEKMYRSQPVQNEPQLQTPSMELEEIRIKDEIFDLATQNFFQVYRARLEDLIRRRVDADLQTRATIDPVVLSELVNLYARRALDTVDIEKQAADFFQTRLFARFGDSTRAKLTAISWAHELAGIWQTRIVEALLPDIRAHYLARSDAEVQRYGKSFFQQSDLSHLTGGSSDSSLTQIQGIPPRESYLLRPGDRVKVVTYNVQGGQSESSVPLDANGVSFVEGLGPVPLSGMTADQAGQTLTSQISRTMPSFRIRVSLEAATQLRVFLVGEVQKPGVYYLNPGATALDALLVAGGPSQQGTFRRIELQRNGRKLSTIDLYAILAKGNFQASTILVDGDRIFIPARGEEVSVIGEVLRPALYELKNEQTLKQILALAGGVQPTAYSPSAQVQRLLKNRTRVLEDISLAKADKTRVFGGDKIVVKSLLPDFANGVYLDGAVQRPGWYSLTENSTVALLLTRAEGLQKRPVARVANIYRTRPGQPLEILNFDVLLAQTGETHNNLALQKGDRVVIHADESVHFQNRKVLVRGEVQAPGEYQRFEGMRVSDILAAARGVTPEATTVEIARTHEDGQIEIIPVNLVEALANPMAMSNELLRDQDLIVVRPGANRRRYPATIAILGQVSRPGDYPFEATSTSLRDIMARAGGVLPTAYPNGAVLIRRKNEIVPYRDRIAAQDIFTTVQEVERQFALAEALRNGGPNGAEALSQLSGQAGRLTNSLESLSSGGSVVPARAIDRILTSERVPIDFPSILEGRTDMRIRDGDILYIPEVSSTVVVSGAVNLPTALAYTLNKSARWYIDQAGGFSPDANEDRVLVLRANGLLAAEGRSAFIEPGDLILVPPRAIVAEPSFWERFVQILQIGVNAAVLSSILR